MATQHMIQAKEFAKEALPQDAPAEAYGLLALWQQYAGQGEGGLPTRDDFTPETLAPWIEDISIYEYQADKDDFQILLEGENIIALTGEDWRGAYAREIDFHYSTSLHASMSLARTTAQPQIHMLQIFQKDWRSGVRLLLPITRKHIGEEDRLQVFLAIFPMRDLMS
ncbi:hypothetical protein [Thalassospira lucentensis]|uniref:hypothetical protein n=1 Tax=Thalassospira lucentensis TaxID=168935 RepID=UPI003AA946AD